MTGLLSDEDLHKYLDQIAVHGCAEVNRMIVAMEAGDIIPEIAELPAAQQQQVFTELKQVMLVYDSCETRIGA